MFAASLMACVPLVLASLVGVPHKRVFARFCVALPFIALICVFAVVSDTASASTIFGVVVSRGVVFSMCLVLRTYSCVAAMTILLYVMPFDKIMDALRACRVPKLFVMILEMTYRYVGTIGTEAQTMYTAYVCRAGSTNKPATFAARGVDLRHAGSFAGSLFLRSVGRAERIQDAMKCRRGF